MKTSEFVSYVKKKWSMDFEKNDAVINIGGIMKVHTNRQLIEFDKRTVSTQPHLKLIEKAIEYTETPLEEREEEKKYYLLFPEDFASVRLFLKHSYSGYDRTHDKNAYYEINTKTQFTQKEIDEMPFDTNFFVKEEVK